jgi:hypothetical protein
MTPAVRRTCANPACSCEASDGGCSPWCRAMDRPAGEWCRCGHESCAPAPALGGLPGRPAPVDSRVTRELGDAGPRWLVVVRQDRPELDPAGRTALDEPLCLVVRDRRRRDRRQGRALVRSDRRRGERRQALTPEEAEQWCRAGYRLVYRGGAESPPDGRTSGDVEPAGGEP